MSSPRVPSAFGRLQHENSQRKLIHSPLAAIASRHRKTERFLHNHRPTASLTGSDLHELSQIIAPPNESVTAGQFKNLTTQNANAHISDNVYKDSNRTKDQDYQHQTA